jgi:putative transposase
MIVDIHGWCLMGNHYHLLLSERIEGGMSEFLKKLNGGYAKYFNEKNDRAGALFQGKSKRVLIDSDAHYLYILHYIHLNPLDFLSGANRWREPKVTSTQKALSHLEDYRWSSYLDYCGTRNFPSILTKSVFSETFRDYRKSVGSYLRDIELSSMQGILLE